MTTHAETIMEILAPERERELGAGLEAQRRTYYEAGVRKAREPIRAIRYMPLTRRLRLCWAILKIRP